MANIKVDHKKLENAADAIDTYVSQHKKNMKTIDMKFMALGTAWQGEDFNQVRKEWREIKGEDSTSDNMIDSLKNYADALRDAAERYKKVQADAVNRAKNKCK